MHDWKQYVRQHLKLGTALPEQEQDAVDELARQLEDAYKDALSRGLAPDAAEAEAMTHIADWSDLSRQLQRRTRYRSSNFRRFVRESTEPRTVRLFGSLGADIRYGLRTILKTPAFVAVAVATLALGIGANTAIFSVVDAVLFRPLPYTNSERIVMVWERRPQQNRERNSVAPADFLDWRAQNRVFESIASFQSQNLSITESGQPERIAAAIVSKDFFSVFGVDTAAGRIFTAEEEDAGNHHVAILSHGLWKRRFNADPAIIGKTISLNLEPYTVVGILPETFQFRVGDDASPIWLPLGLPPAEKVNRGLHYLTVFARLKPATTLEQARAEMDGLSKQLEGQYPGNRGHYTNVFPLFEESVGKVRQSLLVLLAAVGFVLLIACANVANLLLLRNSSRRKELAIRNAIGASRFRIGRQLLVESLVLSLTGGGAGVLLAIGLVPLLKELAPPGTPRLSEVTLDVRVLAFSLAISFVTGLGFGLAPAFQAFRLNMNDALRQSGRASTGKRGGRLRSVLVVCEVAVALLLLIGAGLMARSLSRLQNVPMGFNAEGVLTVQLSLPPAKYRNADEIPRFFTQLADRVRSLPGVLSVGGAVALPSGGSQSGVFFGIEGRPPQPPGQGLNAAVNWVTPGYFETMKIPLIKGRLFNDTDTANAPRVTVINETMARQFWPGEDPIGQQVIHSATTIRGNVGEEARTIVGVVGDTRQQGPLQPSRPEMFDVIAQNPSRFLTVVVRSDASPLALAGPVRSEVLALDPQLPLAQIRSMQQILDNSVVSTRFSTQLFSGFALTALLLAVVGLYGVIGYHVRERFHELGLRMALGARSTDVIRMVLAQGLVLAGLGNLLGLGAALYFNRFLEKLLFNVSRNDPWTIVAVSALLMLVATAACYIPARRASRIDPLKAVRGD